MLHTINLYVLDKIFAEIGKNKVSTISKMIYQNCLTHHFKQTDDSQMFYLSVKEYPKLANYLSNFRELETFGIVLIAEDTICFKDVWNLYVKKQMPIQSFLGAFEIKSMDDFKDDLENNQHLYELSAMKYKINKEQFNRLINMFLVEQKAFNKQYINGTDLIKHFSFWIPHNVKNVNSNAEKNKPKLLGE